MIGLEEKVQEKEPKAPEFIMQLEDLTADEGDNAKFIAKVDGHPRPRVTWSINNIDIATVNDLLTTFSSHFSIVLSLPLLGKSLQVGLRRSCALSGYSSNATIRRRNHSLYRQERSGSSRKCRNIDFTTSTRLSFGSIENTWWH